MRRRLLASSVKMVSTCVRVRYSGSIINLRPPATDALLIEPTRFHITFPALPNREAVGSKRRRRVAGSAGLAEGAWGCLRQNTFGAEIRHTT